MDDQDRFRKFMPAVIVAFLEEKGKQKSWSEKKIRWKGEGKCAMIGADQTFLI